MEEMKKIIIHLNKKYQGEHDKVFKALKDFEIVTGEQIKAIEEKLKNENVITIVDSNYPDAFKRTSKPPFAFSYKGDFEKLTPEFEQGIFIKGSDWEKNQQIWNQEKAELLKENTLISFLSNESEIEIVKEFQKNGNKVIILCSPKKIKSIELSENTLWIDFYIPDNAIYKNVLLNNYLKSLTKEIINLDEKGLVN